MPPHKLDIDGQTARQWAERLDVSVTTIYLHLKKHGNLDLLKEHGVRPGHGAGRPTASFEGRTHDEWVQLLDVSKSTLRYHIFHYNTLDRLKKRAKIPVDNT